MAGKLLPDELWEEIEHLFPEHEVLPQGGRRPIPNRVVVTAILFVLKTGIAWEDLPQELGCSWRTCLRRLTEWNEQGIWRKVHVHLLVKLQSTGRINWSRALLDSGTVKAPRGGENAAPTRRIAGVRAASITS